MKSKIVSFIAFFFVISCVSVFAQDHLRLSSADLVQRYIERGMNEIIPNAALARLNQEELDLLCAAIYAKQGFTFDSDSLFNMLKSGEYYRAYFQQYNWYTPIELMMYVNYVYTFTDIDWENDSNIRVYQNAGNRISPNLQKSQLVGSWIDSFPAPAYCGEFRINNNNTIEVIDPQFEGYYRGRYTIENGFLIVTMTEIYNADNDRWITSQPYRLSFPVWDLEEFDYGGYQVRIGYTRWYGGP